MYYNKNFLRFVGTKLIKIINKDLLEHTISKNTEIYTHVSARDLGKIKSPLDLIMKKSDMMKEVEGDED
ncbi:hypothetical protein AUJ91_00005 [archaeon CG2_30_31_98]|uniref:Uncharacterized protein n=3 Tax=Huberarchaeum crystalense TaxID=2014257 RepID=A0A2H9M478_HUBC1|nr:MAG: hypothetical protein AUJ91_00005 [archaeon CG2_30_31_98]PIV13789.1 MAG: hypothetical protein COS45_00925 [Candidatus Huberarchaeum crystalense]